MAKKKPKGPKVADAPISAELLAAVDRWKADGRSIYQLCKEAGVRQSVVGQWLNGDADATIRLATADKLAKVLGVRLVADAKGDI